MVEQLAKSSVGAVLFGSVTVQHRAGNSGQNLTYYGEHEFSLNSIGLKNDGAGNYAQYLPGLVQLVHDNGKPFVMSVAGFSPEEYGELVEFALHMGVDGIELNLGCPNVVEGGKRHRIVGFYPDLVDETLVSVGDAFDGHDGVSLGVKMPPISDPYQLFEVAQMVKASPYCAFVTTANTFPNALDFADDGSNLIDVPNGYAGYAGDGFFTIALGQVQQWKQALNGYCPVIGVGGVTNASRVTYHLHAGASAVQATSAIYFQESPKALRAKLDELTSYQEPGDYFKG
jgi:dihydroorotate dehydrogenase (fumarate)